MGEGPIVINRMEFADNNTQFVIFSDFNIRSNNRGTAALGYGAIEFLVQEGFVNENFDIIRYRFYRNPFHIRQKQATEELDINEKKKKYHTISVWSFEKWLYKHGLLFFNTLFKQTIEKVKVVGAINGGDGLTDIYGDYWLDYRLPEMNLAIELGIPFVILPQTIGPFLEKRNQERIVSILKQAERIYVRDSNFIGELDKNHLPYIKANDLSYYMEPMPFPIEIKKPCIGINVSGLAYSNRFGNLAGEFDNYPKLITAIVKLFQAKGCNIYLIPHAYNVSKPETNNDDMASTREFYDGLEDKTGVCFVDMDLISPQIKYLISQMDFFIGTRMHANFAAIFTGVPVFGLAYSYKFKGAFENNGIFDHTYPINNLAESQIESVLSVIDSIYLHEG